MPPSLQVMVPGTRQPRIPAYHATYPAFIVRRGADTQKIEVSSSVIPSHPNMQAAPRKRLGEEKPLSPVEKILGIDVAKVDEGGVRVSAAPSTLVMAVIFGGIMAAFNARGGLVKLTMSGLTGAGIGAGIAALTRLAASKDF